MFLTIKLCTYAELFEIELFICIKMDSALNNAYAIKPKQTNQPNQD